MPPGSRRIHAEDSDSDSDIDMEEAPFFDPAQAEKDEMKRKLMMMELGNDRVHQLTASGKSVRYEDKTSIRKVHAARRVNQVGTEEALQGQRDRTQLAAWNNPVNIGEYGAPVLDDFNSGQEHRQRLINDLAAGDGKDPANEKPARYSTHGSDRNGGSRGIQGGFGESGRLRLAPSRQTESRNQNSAYHPLDPAVDPKAEYGYKNRTRHQVGYIGRAGGGAGHCPARGGQNKNNAAGAGSHGRAVAASSRGGLQPRTRKLIVSHSLPAGVNLPDMLAAPDAFMAHVNNMKKSKENTPPSTKEHTPSTGAKVSAKVSSSHIEPHGPPIRGSNDTTAKKNPALNHHQSSLQGESSGHFQSAKLKAEPIHQVPTNELALPPPHRGGTDSWTDGVPSPTSLDLGSSSSGTSQRGLRHSPAIIDDIDPLPEFGIDIKDTGLVLSNVHMPISKKPKSKSPHEKDKKLIDGNIIDFNDDGIDDVKISTLTKVQERIRVGCHWYILDKSALGNAPPPPPPPTPIVEPRNCASGEQKAASSRADIVCNGSMPRSIVLTETTPSLGQSKFASLEKSFPFKRVTVGNPFSQPNMSRQTAATPTSRPADVKALSNEFAAFAVQRPKNKFSSIATTFDAVIGRSTAVKPTSCVLNHSASLNPTLNGNLASSDWSTLAAPTYNTSSACSHDITSKAVVHDPNHRSNAANTVPVTTINREVSTRHVGSAPIQVTPLDNAIVDPFKDLTLEERMVRFTQVGSNAGLTPFSSSASVAARYGRGSVVINMANSESRTPSARRSSNLTASMYAPADTDVQVEKKSFGALKLKDGNSSGNKKPAESKTASVVLTCSAIPNSAGIHRHTGMKKTAPGAGFKLLQEELAAAAAAAAAATAAVAPANTLEAPSQANAEDSSSEL